VRQKLLNLKAKSAKFQKAYDFPDAYRTSNSLDRLMNYQDRALNTRISHKIWKDEAIKGL